MEVSIFFLAARTCTSFYSEVWVRIDWIEALDVLLQCCMLEYALAVAPLMMTAHLKMLKRMQLCTPPNRFKKKKKQKTKIRGVCSEIVQAIVHVIKKLYHLTSFTSECMCVSAV